MSLQYYGNLEFSDNSPLTFSNSSPLDWGFVRKLFSNGNKVRQAIVGKFTRR